MNLKNQVVVVFGGGRGIGKAIAHACAKNGAKVALAARTLPEVEEVASELRRSYDTRVLALACDVASYEQVNNLIEETEKSLGPVQGMVCAAGIYGAIGPVDETSPEVWRQAIEVNLIGTFNCIHASVKSMKKRRSGQIVLFSGGGQGAIPNFSSYTASKGGIWRLTETVGAELEPFGIYVNAIAPGLVNTRFLDDLLVAGEEKVGRDLYQKSVKQKQEGGIPPEQAADLVLYLLSGESKNLSGKILSARWDDYRSIRDFDAVNKSDLYTAKRVVSADGGTRPVS